MSKSHFVKLIFFLFFIVSLTKGEGQPANPLLSYDVLYQWKQLDYNFDPPSLRQDYIKSKKFIPANNVITGIKVTDNRVFLTVPRWRSGVPATLVNLAYNSSGSIPFGMEVTSSGNLIPYPSWSMQELGNCSALQYVQSMEIDQFNRMWVVDVGRVNIFEDKPDNKCPPKLVLIDLSTNNTLRTYEFPSSVVNRTGSFLNDIVVGCQSKDDCWAYITDAFQAKIIVYNYKLSKSWFVQHPTMKINQTALKVTMQDGQYTFKANVDGIALSPFDSGFSTLFYCPLSSYQLFSVPTAFLQRIPNSKGGGFDLDDGSVRTLGTKSSQTDGMVIDASGLLYFGLLGSNSINSWNSSYSRLTPKNQALVVQSDIDLQWPDTFGMDKKGYVFVTTNRLQKFTTNSYDFAEINFRVLRFFVGLKSYMFSKSDSIQIEPVSEPEPESGPVPRSEPEPSPESEPSAEPSAEPPAAEPESEPIPEPEGDSKNIYKVDNHTGHHHDGSDNRIGKSSQVTTATAHTTFDMSTSCALTVLSSFFFLVQYIF